MQVYLMFQLWLQHLYRFNIFKDSQKLRKFPKAYSVKYGLSNKETSLVWAIETDAIYISCYLLKFCHETIL